VVGFFCTRVSELFFPPLPPGPLLTGSRVTDFFLCSPFFCPLPTQGTSARPFFRRGGEQFPPFSPRAANFPPPLPHPRVVVDIFFLAGFRSLLFGAGFPPSLASCKGDLPKAARLSPFFSPLTITPSFFLGTCARSPCRPSTDPPLASKSDCFFFGSKRLSLLFPSPGCLSLFPLYSKLVAKEPCFLFLRAARVTPPVSWRLLMNTLSLELSRAGDSNFPPPKMITLFFPRHEQTSFFQLFAS